MFIEQAYKSDYHFATYIPFAFCFFGLMVLQFFMLQFLSIDTNAMMEAEIAKIGKNLFLLENLVPFAFFLGVLLLWIKFVHKQKIISVTTSRPKIDWKRIFFSFGIWSLFVIITTFIDFYTAPESYRWSFDLEPFLKLMVIAIVFIPIQTSFEEYLFRGYLMQGIGMMAGNRWLPLLLTSTLFGLMHLSNPEVEKMGFLIMIYYIGTGFFLGIIILMDDGMELALGFHAANNLVGCLLVTSGYSALQTHAVLTDVSEPTAGLDIILPVFIIYPILLFIFSKKYKWNSWKEKLTGKVQEITPDKNLT